MASKSFGAQGPAIPHSVPREVADLRADVEAGFVVMENQVECPMPAQANIRLNTQPTAADTLTIGTDIYEFKAALSDAVTTAGNINVLRGASAAAALANVILAVNGGGVLAGVSASNGTKNVKASIYNTDFLHIEPTSDRPGGTVQTGPGPNIALSDGLTASVAWDHANLNEMGWGGTFKRAVMKIKATTANIAADFDVLFPFVPYVARCLVVTSAAGAPDAAKTSNVTLTIVQARSAVTVDLNGGGGTDAADTDLVYIEVLGF